MAYKTYKRRKYGYKTRQKRLRSTIKNVLLRNTETKTVSTERTFGGDDTNFQYNHWIETLLIPTSTDNYGRTGDKVMLSGIKFEIIGDNTSNDDTINDQPLFISWALVMCKSEIGEMLRERFFKTAAEISQTYGLVHTADVQGFPNTLTKTAAAFIHTWPINREDFKILKRGNFRLGTHANDSLVGPTFHHVKGYCPLKEPITWGKRRTDLTNSGVNERDKDLKLVFWVTDPTGEDGPTATKKVAPQTNWKVHLRSQTYFKDI